jgi:5'-3' exonuclease
METVIFDGHNLAIRCGRAPHLAGLVNAEGDSTSEAFGVLHALATFRKRYAGARLLVVWEGSSRHRRSLFPAYKGAKHDASDAYGVRFLKEALPTFGVEQAYQPEEEADDVIASLLTEPSGDGDRFILVSTDRDYWQLVSERTSLLVPPAKSGGEEKVYLPTSIESEFGVRPEQMVDVRALAGDDSDNLPGVQGFGLQQASKAIRAYGDLDSLFASSMMKLSALQRTRVRAAQAQVRLNASLMKLRQVGNIVKTPAASSRSAAESQLRRIGADDKLLGAFFPSQLSLLG